jgi:hypothetical protein
VRANAAAGNAVSEPIALAAHHSHHSVLEVARRFGMTA